MGACDHPATNQPRSYLRFGSTLCYPAITHHFARPAFYRIGQTKSSVFSKTVVRSQCEFNVTLKVFCNLPRKAIPS
ncbi:hypothetical protein MFFC18_21230 [Mariniblastus fucicola]|uniref:Uncharacterized protein n=1 Tax=Mariniblastus fucicola TaxID=980251 RepID=A0A5B9P6L8_9BACT|nr:hypothetical protein MFFC18_21230 [Mariniblastus fucicola]